VIVIQPTNPQLVYVPQFNPTVVYGTPVPRPDYSTAAVVTTALLAFGAGIAVGAAITTVVAAGAIVTGTATGTAEPLSIKAMSTTEMQPGMAASMVPVSSPMARMAPRGLGRLTIRRQELTQEVRRSRLPIWHSKCRRSL
jgi:hypothetical protein